MTKENGGKFPIDPEDISEIKPDSVVFGKSMTVDELDSLMAKPGAWTVALDPEDFRGESKEHGSVRFHSNIKNSGGQDLTEEVLQAACDRAAVELMKEKADKAALDPAVAELQRKFDAGTLTREEFKGDMFTDDDWNFYRRHHCPDCARYFSQYGAGETCLEHRDRAASSDNVGFELDRATTDPWKREILPGGVFFSAEPGIAALELPDPNETIEGRHGRVARRFQVVATAYRVGRGTPR